jgi:hypothetical protein
MRPPVAQLDIASAFESPTVAPLKPTIMELKRIEPWADSGRVTATRWTVLAMNASIANPTIKLDAAVVFLVLLQMSYG